MQKTFVIITTNNPDKATRAAQFAKLAAERGALAGIMLVDDGVYLAEPNVMDRVRAVTGDKFSEHIASLTTDFPMLVCKPCCMARGLEGDEALYYKWNLGTGKDALDIILSPGVTTLTF